MTGRSNPWESVTIKKASASCPVCGQIIYLRGAKWHCREHTYLKENVASHLMHVHDLSRDQAREVLEAHGLQDKAQELEAFKRDFENLMKAQNGVI